ncbi:DNA polymerase [Mycolicibacterium houstonense]|uniref:DNA polymerase n=1 Tax=Mycolicibacterium houstonense TaxID=146021 RepID=UPI000833EFCB|nr:DNA polymerase [Mycolicibacterium houstonense]
MKQHHYKIGDEPVLINVVEHEDDLEGFRDFIRANLRILGLDTETTGLGIYQDGFRLRLVQFGTPYESWVVPAELGPRFQEDIRVALRGVDRFVLQNASFDLQVIEKTLGVPMEELWPKVTDTKILAHLVDPRAVKEGGYGHKLEELTKHYIDPVVAEEVKGSMARIAKAHKTTKDKIWAIVPLDDPDYQLYAGMDPILAARLLQKLRPLVPTSSTKLLPYEHKLAEVMSYVERTGFLLDVEYAETLSADMLRKRDHFTAMASTVYGVNSVNSSEKVADGLERMGVKIKGRTPTGKRKVDAELLEKLQGEGNTLATAVIEAKKWGSWESTWVRNFIERRDSADRVHPGINPLQARTARMSITNPATQNLPAGDWMVRRCFLADEGHRIVSVDYQAQELRVLAALANDRVMINAFKNGDDLHLITAQAAFGPQITKDDPERKYAKVVNFGRIYGGGAGTVAKQTGLDFPTAKKVVEGFDNAYPQVRDFSARLQAEASANGFITTPVGRRLPVDPDRAYSALNYLIQSSSRDVTGAAILRLHEAGLTPYVRLPIHDEVLASAPAAEAAEISHEIARLMRMQMGPVDIGTDPEVGGRSWGSLYYHDDVPPSDPFLIIPT